MDIVSWHNSRNTLIMKLPMSDLHKILHLEQSGLCAVSGLPLGDDFHIQSLDPINFNDHTRPIFKNNTEKLIGIAKQVNIRIGRQLDEFAIKWSLLGMRDSGNVKLIDRFYIAEYENRSLRLQELKDDFTVIRKSIGRRFIIYDYKATIRSDSQEALDYLKKKYGEDISIANDYLVIDDLAMDVIPIKKSFFIRNAKDLWQQSNKRDQQANTLDKATKILVDLDSSEDFEIKDKRSVAPALGVESISELLAKISPELTKDSGMMVGIFGNWGRGKTYLANKIISKIKSKNDWYSVNFSAWKYQNTQSSWSYLHDCILDEFEREKGMLSTLKNYYKRFCVNVNKKGFLSFSFNLFMILALFYWFLFVDKIALIQWVLGLFSFALLFVFLKTFLFLNASSGYFNNIASSYLSQTRYKKKLGLQAEIEESLVAMLKAWIPEKSKSKLVLFVDDIDRCDVKNVLEVIDSLRLILDNPEIYKRIIIIAAIDERILKQAIWLKYHGLQNLSLDDIYAEYLQKIFIVGVKLDQLCEKESVEYFEKLLPNLEDCYTNLPELKATNVLAQMVSHATKQVLDSQKHVQLVEEQIRKISSPSSETEDSSEKIFEKEIANNITEISKSEHYQLIRSISKLKERTPRSIKIFYYKYLISKRLLIDYLNENNLFDLWSESKHEEQLIEHLIAIANNKEIDNSFKNKHHEVDTAIKKVASLVSAI